MKDKVKNKEPWMIRFTMEQIENGKIPFLDVK